MAWMSFESFSQSWFQLLVAGSILVGLWLLHRMRMTGLVRRARSCSEERASARERIARGHHDTLLQDLQGLILRFQAVTERIPAGQEARAELEAALVAADDVVAQARDHAYGLCVHDMGDLCAAVAEIVATTSFDPPIQVRLLVEGRDRNLSPLVAMEVVRIIHEALFNIAQHARAHAAEIAVGFETSHLAIRVRDYGVGMTGEILVHGRKGSHFGMNDMRERADRIGGILTVSSSPDDGSEITLVLPAKLAFSGRMERRSWISRLLRSPKDG